LTEAAILEMGGHCTIQDFTFFLLTLPHPKVYIGNNTVIGSRNIIKDKNLIQIGNDVRICFDVQVIDHGHGIARSATIKEQSALIGKVIIGDQVCIGAGAWILMNGRIGTVR
jgi:acetyltransferase-like isoleucine patch superfamily enzyme